MAPGLERVTSLPTLPKRPADSHKGMYGSIVVVAGSRGMAGAAALCGGSALRSGAGLVRVLCPADVQPTVASFEPSYMTLPIENDADGLLRFEPARKAIERMLENADVLAIGPGLGQSEDMRKLVRWVVESVKVPTVLDADGLNALVGQTELLKTLTRPLVITPHPGEFSRLTGKPTAAIQADREGLAASFAEAGAGGGGDAGQLVVVLKGSRTVVTDGRRVYVNDTGNPGMATGGVGDVLTGVVAALIGQKLPAFEATQLGVYVHGLAGDIARDQNGEIGMIAGDVVDSLPDAFYHLTA
jgi:ADP-dependent NAD(P)H-hydrate dehydratase